MFKAVSLLFLIVAASAREYEELNNLIEYGDSPYGGYLMPYPYQELEPPAVIKPLYSDVIVPASIPVPATEVGFSKLGLVTKAASFAFSLAKKAVVFVFSNIIGLVIGTVAALGLCKFTPICDKLSSLHALYEVPSELRSYATPERLAQASEFVKTAIRKYRSLQDEE